MVSGPFLSGGARLERIKGAAGFSLGYQGVIGYQAGAVAPSSKRDTRRPIATRAIIPTYENRSL